jgi:photosystem II stability/assembly factor-like uncharacterized protein
VSPAGRDRALIACDMTGSYLTEDGGLRWRQIDFGAVARAFVFDPGNPDTIWAGASGLFRSDDAGGSWRLVLPRPGAVRGERYLGDEADHRFEAEPPWPGGVVEAILVDPADPRRVLVGIAGCGPGDRLAVLESHDGGESFVEVPGPRGREWVALLPGRNPGNVIAVTDAGVWSVGTGASTCLPRPPGVSRIVAAARCSATYLTAAASEPIGQFEMRLLRSLDEGASWEDLSAGLSGPLATNEGIRFPFLAAGASAFRPGQPDDTIYLSVAEPPADRLGADQPFGILKSSDSGKTWSWSLRVAGRQPENRIKGWVEADFAPEWGGAPFGLGVRPGDPDCCYATDWGTVYRTVDGGSHWEQLYAQEGPAGAWTNRGVNVTNVYGVFFDPFIPGRAAMACTDVGLFESSDGGRRWRHAMAGVPSSWRNTCYWLVFDRSRKGRAWSAWSGCHDLPRVKMLRTDAYRSSPGGVARTDDGMASWNVCSTGLPQAPVTHLDVDPDSPVKGRHLLAAVFGHGVFASRDGGESWHEASAGIGINRNAWNLCRSGPVVWLLVARGLRAGAVEEGALYRTDDGGASWRPVALPPEASFPNALAVDPGQPRRLYLACWPREVDGRQKGGGLLASEDGGASWTRCFDESVHAYGVTVCPGGAVFLCTFEGRTWRSTDHGRSWEIVDGITFKWQKTVQPDPRDPSRIFISTFGAGLWHGPASGPAGAPGPRFHVRALDVAPGERET